MSQHTPGPWTVGDATEGEILAGRDQHVVAIAYHNDPRQDANARLIAAAPELLAELRLLMNVGRTVIDARPELDWNRLCALLARIEGDNP